jgi:endoglucanase
VLDALASPTRWRANAVRVPVNQEWFLTDEAYVGRVEAVIDAAALRGLYVVLDLQWEHAKATDPYQLNILPRPTFGEGLTTEAFWHLASGRLSSRQHVLFDLINEPHDTSADQLAAAMQQLVDSIHEARPEQLVVVGGPDWAQSVAFFADHPLRGDNVVYSAHQYPPYDLPAQFHENFERTAAVAPVLLGEVSVEAVEVDGRPWQDVLVERAEAAGVDGWLPWAVGCGLAVDDDLRGPAQVRSLAAQLRALNP